MRLDSDTCAGVSGLADISPKLRRTRPQRLPYLLPTVALHISQEPSLYNHTDDAKVGQLRSAIGPWAAMPSRSTTCQQVDGGHSNVFGEIL